MFKKTAWIIGVIAALSLIVGLHGADAGYWDYGNYMHIEFTFGGTYLDTRMDLNHDGSPVSWSTGQISGTLGNYIFQAVSENVSKGITTECNWGVSSIDEQNGFGIETDTFPNGDQLYSAISTRTICANNGSFSASQTGFFVGGTGKFVGVSGTYENTWTGYLGVFDNTPNHEGAFGSFTGKGTAILIFPHKEYWEHR